MGRPRVEARADLAEDLAHLRQRHRLLRPLREDLDEAAHMRAALVMRQFDGHLEDPGDTRAAAILLADHHGQVDIAHAHILDGDPPLISFRCDVAHDRPVPARPVVPSHGVYTKRRARDKAGLQPPYLPLIRNGEGAGGRGRRCRQP